VGPRAVLDEIVKRKIPIMMMIMMITTTTTVMKIYG
jgi:hypothetical protein